MKVRTGDSLPFSFSKYSTVAGVTQCTQVQTESIPNNTVQTQTEKVYVLTPEQFHQLQQKGTPSSPPGVSPANSPTWQQLLKGSSSPVFEVNTMGKKLKLTDRQFKERKRSDPEIKRAKISLNAKERTSLRSRICRRVSKQYRNRRNASRAKYVAKTKHGKVISEEDSSESSSLRKNAFITRLIEFFFDEYLQKERRVYRCLCQKLMIQTLMMSRKPERIKHIRTSQPIINICCVYKTMHIQLHMLQRKGNYPRSDCQQFDVKIPVRTLSSTMNTSLF